MTAITSPLPTIGQGATIWLTGLPGAGKSTISTLLVERFASAGQAAYVLDGDNLRTGLNADLGFTREDRQENVRRVGEVARLFADAGIICITALISPYAADRDTARAVHEATNTQFFEIHIATPIDVCQDRDPKGLYAKSQTGDVVGLTGVNDPYEIPEEPDFRVITADRTPQESASELFELITSALST